MEFLAGELHQALLAARVRDEQGPAALTVWQAQKATKIIPCGWRAAPRTDTG